jgi:hypothetical protein
VNNRLNLKERVAKLEAIIQSLAPDGGGRSSSPRAGDSKTDALPDTPLSLDKASSSQNSHQITSTVTNSGSGFDPLGPDIGQKIGPISSLFNNAIVSQHPPSPFVGSGQLS